MKRLHPLYGVLFLVIALLAVWFVWGGHAAWDDAYITFRYARNVAEGYGIVYNPGDAPTQGSTTMLFMLLLAGAIRLGIEPTAMAFTLNALGVLAIVLCFYRFSRAWVSERIAALFALAVGVYTLVLQNQMTALETNFWTGLIFLGLLAYQRYKAIPSPRRLAVLIMLSLLACLTRPESVLIVGLWWLGLLRFHFRKIIPGLLIAGVIGAAYLLLLKLYFGDVFPNPFYVKAGYSEEGFLYVARFVLFYLVTPLFLVGVITIRKTMLFSVFILPIFYLFTNPLIGENYRFLHPTTCAFVFISAYGLYHLVTLIKPAPLLRFGIGCVVGYLAFIHPTVLLTLDRIGDGLSTQMPLTPLTQTAQSLSHEPETIKVAYGDAGEIPFTARNVKFLDLVGLNDTTIAHQGAQKGAGWVIDYVFQQQPDLIGFYIGNDGHILNNGHGAIGPAYSQLYDDARFRAYDLVGVVDYNRMMPNINVAWFARKDSPSFQAAEQAIQKVASPFAAPITP